MTDPMAEPRTDSRSAALKPTESDSASPFALSQAPTERFSSRVESYRSFRPHYPEAMIPALDRLCGLSPEDTVADLAAGTGIFTEQLLRAGHTVVAVEPNEAMRASCEALKAEFPRLSVKAGTAEQTGLPDHSVALITVAQALHWFDHKVARAEFVRILRPGGWCAVIYNHRRMSGNPFHEGYEQILEKFGTDYAAVRARREPIDEFFAPLAYEKLRFENYQDLTLEALIGRLVSSSYMPQPGHPNYEAMIEAATALFAAEQKNGPEHKEGTVRLCYDAIAYCARLGGN